MRLSDLVDRLVVTESGDRLGHAFDFRGRWSGNRLELVGIVVARQGLYERLGVVAARASRTGHHGSGDVIPWDAVVRLRGKTIVVRDDAVSAS